MTTAGKIRYELIDGIRGITIVSMVLFHFFYDVFMIYGLNSGWYANPGIHLWQQSICWTFILISGFVWSIGKKHNIRRGIMLNFWGLVITAVTWVVMPDDAVIFGILNFMGCAVLILAGTERLFKKIPPAAGLIISFLLFMSFYHISDGMIGIGSLSAELPSFLYEIKPLVVLGFPFEGFSSSDYFPILPWFFLYLCGYYLYELLKECRIFQKAAVIRLPFFSWLGKKSIWIYLIHQPVNMLICILLFDVLKILQ